MINTTKLIPIIGQYAQDTKARIQQLSEIVQDSPRGSLFIKTVNGKQYYYRMVSNSGKKETQYIKRSQTELINRLADKRVAGSLLPKLHSNLRAAESFLKLHSGLEICEMEALLDPALTGLCSSKCLDRKATIDNWLAETWTERPYLEFPPTQQTLKGPLVRSKSEVMISNSLFLRGIPYHNEKPLFYSPNRPPIFPDLTIMHPITCELWFWEHFGLIEKPSYFEDMCRKLEIFQSLGITPGHRLICTFECEKHPLSSVLIDELIQFHFG